MNDTRQSVERPALASQQTIGGMIRDRATVTPGAAAIAARNRRDMIYGELAAQTDRIARQLRGQGYGPASRLAVVHRGGAEMIATLLGTVSCAIAVPLGDEVPTTGLAALLAALRIDGLLVDAALDTPARDVARAMGLTVIDVRPGQHGDAAGHVALDLPSPAIDGAAAPSGPEDVAFIFGTSGTTRAARLVPLRHRHMMSRSESTAVLHELTASDRCFNQNRLFLCSGISNACTALYAGGCVIHPDDGERFDLDAFVGGLLTLRPTWYVASYNFNVDLYRSLQADPSPVAGHRLRFIRATSGRLAPGISAGLESIFGVPVIEAYSSTESGRICGNPLPPKRRKHGTVGPPTLGSEVSIVDDGGRPVADGERGEVVVRGGGVFDGYDHDPAANDEAFFGEWYRTGDVGCFDEDGYLTLVGRTREMINRGGQKIAPVEVDEALLTHAEISDAAAFAVAHPVLGEVVGAAIVAKPGSRLTEQAIIDHLRACLEPFKWPRAFVFVEHIPRGPSGKIRRQEVVALFDTLHAFPHAAGARRGAGGEGAESPTEAKLGELWRALLRKDAIGRDDDFFLIGGDSLAATQLVLTVNGLFHVELNLAAVFDDARTIRTMAARIEALEHTPRTGRTPDLPVLAIDERVALPRDREDPEREARHKRAGTDSRQLALFVLDKATGLRLMRPGATFGAVVANSHGFRSPEISLQKSAGRIRFAFLGDSLTFGSWTGGNETTWPFHAVEAVRNADDGMDCDYINAAMPGNGIRHVSVLFRDAVAKFRPDIVALAPGVGGNSAVWARKRLGYIGIHYSVSRLGQKWPLVGLVEKNLVIRLRQARALTDRGKLVFEPHELEELSRDFRRELSDLVLECRDAGAVVVLLTRESKIRRDQSKLRQILAAGSRLYYQPYMSMSALLDVKDEFNRVCREVAAQTGAVLVELADAMPATREYFEDSSHCTPAANRLIGEVFGRTLRQSHAFAQLLRDRLEFSRSGAKIG